MANSENEKKGIVYEAFVKLALKKVRGINALWEPTDFSGVLANQDFVYPNVCKPEFVIAVTHWGSHEAANKKFWRTIEDRYEVYCAYPQSQFFSILFEKPVDSDDGLVELLRMCCLGKAISINNSDSVSILQGFVDDDIKVNSFGTGKEEVFLNCEEKYNKDRDFKKGIVLLGSEISELLDNELPEYEIFRQFLEEERKRKESRNAELKISGNRSTYYKMGLLDTLFLSADDMKIVINAIEKDDWTNVPKGIIEKLEAQNLIKRQNLARKIQPSSELLSVASMGEEKFAYLRKQFDECVEDSDSTLSLCKDHYFDVVDSKRRKKLYDFFVNVDNIDEMIVSETSCGDITTKRIWLIDYYCAIKRQFVRGKEYGIRKMSGELGLPYTGGGVSSPLPVYASGNVSRVDDSTKHNIFSYILEEKKKLDFSKVSDTAIVGDRITTMKKKFDVIELLISNAFSSVNIPREYITTNYIVHSPFISEEITIQAGSTKYNYLVKNNKKAVMIFIVSAYEASHKHKEVAGRMRFAKHSGDYPTADVKNIVVLDGTLLANTPDGKRQMLYDAGWDEVYYVDEVKEMALNIKKFLR